MAMWTRRLPPPAPTPVPFVLRPAPCPLDLLLRSEMTRVLHELQFINHVTSVDVDYAINPLSNRTTRSYLFCVEKQNDAWVVVRARASLHHYSWSTTNADETTPVPVFTTDFRSVKQQMSKLPFAISFVVEDHLDSTKTFIWQAVLVFGSTAAKSQAQTRLDALHTSGLQVNRLVKYPWIDTLSRSEYERMVPSQLDGQT
jgi:hypothetical protein